MELIGHGLAFEPAFLQGGVLVYGAEFGSPAARHREFWTSLCDPEGRLLAHLRFERRLGLGGRALFALAEVRLPPAEEDGERGTPPPFLTPAEFARASQRLATDEQLRARKPGCTSDDVAEVHRLIGALGVRVEVLRDTLEEIAARVRTFDAAVAALLGGTTVQQPTHPDRSET